MHLKVEVNNLTRVYIHDMKPVVQNLQEVGREPLYCLSDTARDHKGDPSCHLTVFFDTLRLQDLYAQLKDIFEPAEVPAPEQPVAP